MSQPSFTIRIVESLEKVDPAAWDACANPAEGLAADSFNPFVAHAFLVALERSGSVGGRSGWTPAHVLVEDASGGLVAAAPSYLKSHSLGEYVFDSSWADAYQRAGGRYYPKIQVAAPFTPVSGRRLLLRGDAPAQAGSALIQGLRALRERTGASSLHLTFIEQDESEKLQEAGFLLRTGVQFHFLNRGYRNFDDFLGELSSRKRKALKRERREALGADISIELLTGADIKPRHWDRFFAFYMDTGSRKWGRPYLTRAFFDHIGASMADRILLVMARRGDDHIAGAINFLGDHAIYGRNWGALEERPFLHFEVCYYQAIEYAIRNGYRRVEAGAQGEHKLARGYRPALTLSAHEFADPRFGAAVADFLVRERSAVDEMMTDCEAALPFRHGSEEACD
ncbi:GNAT family N-acetyltransferase [Methylocystis heyeri]|uniref:GNAT family N-acetyltransferase n=1 Tax=Methylocystis heyeri TaxID=391905 RepID=A0A6B8KFR0_9HYPH|nr:GNAT family N-acetyltransferase [Methylocystis heyeri]QGM47166.1 GNAT family N-acetyltransferase [Methylocystis heyeri]